MTFKTILTPFALVLWVTPGCLDRKSIDTDTDAQPSNEAGVIDMSAMPRDGAGAIAADSSDSDAAVDATAADGKTDFPALASMDADTVPDATVVAPADAVGGTDAAADTPWDVPALAPDGNGNGTGGSAGSGGSSGKGGSGGTSGTGGVAGTGGAGTGGNSSGNGGSSGTGGMTGTGGAGTGGQSTGTGGTSLPPAQLTLNPSSAAFGNALVGSSAAADATFTVSNAGGVASGGLMLTPSASFSLVATAGDCTTSQVLAAGGSCKVHVRFSPAARGSISGTLQVSTTPGGSQSAALSGVGQTPATLVTTNSPPSGSFGSVIADGATLSPEFLWIVANTGDVPTGKISYPGGATVGEGFFISYADPCLNTGILAPGTSCTVHVQWTPSNRGAQSTVYQAVANPGGTATLSMTGNALAPAKLVTQNPGSAGSFGTVALGSLSPEFLWVIANTGDVPTGKISYPGGATVGEGFFISYTDPCLNTGILAAGVSCTAHLQWSPTSTHGIQSSRYNATASPGGTAFIDMTGTVP